MIRLIGYFFGIGTVMALLGAAAVALYVVSISKDLPDYEVLAKYEPPVMTRIHSSDGQLWRSLRANAGFTCQFRLCRTG